MIDRRVISILFLGGAVGAAALAVGPTELRGLDGVEPSAGAAAHGQAEADIGDPRRDGARSEQRAALEPSGPQDASEPPEPHTTARRAPGLQRPQVLAATAQECPADLTSDGAVGVDDLLVLLANWGDCPEEGPCEGDIDGSSTVGVDDLLMLLAAWGPCPEASTGEDCDDAIPVAVDGPVATTSTVGNVVADIPSCGPQNPPSSGVAWFSVVGDGTTLSAATCGSDLVDTRMAVFCGTCAESACVTGAQGGCPGGFQSQVTWCSEPDATYYVAVWGQGATEGDVVLNVTSQGTCEEPAKCAATGGPCQGHCGEFSPDGDCWCDELICGLFGDCCPGVCDDCPGLPFCDGPGLCELEPCPPGASQEGEPCGSDTNGGCNSAPQPLFGELTCGETVCGNLWAQGGDRDTDWYHLDLTGASGSTQITFSAEAENPVVLFILSGDCPETVLTEPVVGCDTSVTACLQPGVYSLFLAPPDFSGAPCPGFSYQATVTCDGPCGGCQGACGGQSPEGCWCTSDCHFLGDCCPDLCDACPDLPQCGAAQCAGFCGDVTPSGCWCDEVCHCLFDCCPDVCETCGHCECI